MTRITALQATRWVSRLGPYLGIVLVGNCSSVTLVSRFAASIHLRYRNEVRRKQGVVAMVDPRDGRVLPRLDRARAEELARADFANPVKVATAELITENLPIEARGRRLPVWRVELDHSRHPRIYLDAVTGEVVARRNSWWRVYDFFYMLHLMDYTERERIHHPLLSIAAALAVLTSLSSVALWGWRAATRPRSTRAS